MNPKKKNTASGVITFHTPFPVSLLKSEECMADVRDATESRKSPPQPSARTGSTGNCVRARKRDEASPSGPQPATRQDRLSPTSLRRLQAKMEAEKQWAKEIIQPLLGTQNGFMKELESFLSQRDVAELRRRELLHKRWTERVWFPLQRRVEEHVSSCGPVEAKRHQSLYSRNLHHCNNKLSTADLKDPLYLQLHERLKEKKAARTCDAACKYKLPQSDRPLSESVTSQADILVRTSSNYPVSASRTTPTENETEGRKSSRLDTIPYHIRATATPDGRCHQTGCWLSRCGASLHPTSK